MIIHTPSPAFISRKRKAAPQQAPPPVALMLVSAEVLYFDGPDGQVRLTFNTTVAQPLVDVAGAAATKWTARYGGVAYVGSTFEDPAYNAVTINFGATGDDPGADGIDYSNAPSDIGDSIGRQLAAFGGFPFSG